MTIIGIAGKKRSGKDTVCQYIKQLYGNNRVGRIAFADALKDEVARACNVTTEYIDQNKDHFRLILQGWGTDFRRMLGGEDYWINRLLLQLRDTAYNIVVIPDVRFINEAEFIRKIGGYVIRVNRMDGHTTDTHASETQLDRYHFDYTIQNDGTLQDLLQSTKSMLTTLNRKP